MHLGLARRAHSRRLGVGCLADALGVEFELLGHLAELLDTEALPGLDSSHQELEVRLEQLPGRIELVRPEQAEVELVQLGAVGLVGRTDLRLHTQRLDRVRPAEYVLRPVEHGQLVLGIGVAVGSECRRHVDHRQKGDGREDEPERPALEILPDAPDGANEGVHLFLSTCCNA